MQTEKYQQCQAQIINSPAIKVTHASVVALCEKLGNPISHLT